MADIIEEQFLEAQDILQRFYSDPSNIQNIRNAGEIMAKAILNGNKIIACGNGGSMCDAMHFAEELSGRFRENRRALPAIAISDPSYISCTANDYGYGHIFSRFIEGFGKPGDVLMALSTSGNSENILEAIRAAKSKQMKIVGLTGKGGGKMAGSCDVEIRAPHSHYSDRAQEIHIKVIHALITYLEQNCC